MRICSENSIPNWFGKSVPISAGLRMIWWIWPGKLFSKLIFALIYSPVKSHGRVVESTPPAAPDAHFWAKSTQMIS